MTFAAGMPDKENVYFGGDLGKALDFMRRHGPLFPACRLKALATPADLLWYEQERRQDAAQS